MALELGERRLFVHPSPASRSSRFFREVDASFRSQRSLHHA
jgi:hypothetical protein